jgi:hypothetical protein
VAPDVPETRNGTGNPGDSLQEKKEWASMGFYELRLDRNELPALEYFLKS